MKKLSFVARLGVATSAIALACTTWNFMPGAAAQGKTTLSSTAHARFAQQLKTLDAFRNSLSASQRKLPSSLLLAKSTASRTRASLPGFSTSRELGSLQNTQSVLIYGKLTDRIKTAIEREGQLTGFFPKNGVASARLTTEAMEHIASATEVTSIIFNPGPQTYRAVAPQGVGRGRAAASSTGRGTFAGTGAVVSEGDLTHEAAKARTQFNVSGAGFKIGVISDSCEALAQLKKLKELPDDVEVLTGQEGDGESEGTAMMEIIHDLAPDAKLEFSSSGDSPEQMAQNILDLKKDGCKIIVDDIGFFTETIYQEDVVSAAIRQVTSQGVLYLSAAGNLGNRRIGPTSVWDGYFVDGGTASVGTDKNAIENDWNSQKDTFNMVASGTGVSGAILSWAEPKGKATNDYNLYFVDASGNIVNFSTGVQNGTGEAQEIISSGKLLAKGMSVVVTRPASSEALPIRLSLFNYQMLLEHSVGPTGFGHNIGEFALTVGASPAQAPGPAPGAFSATSKIEDFSSTGPRKLYFTPEGARQDRVIQKPDITAADNVTCKTDGFDPFFGTSAAAPHAAAIAALAWSAFPNATANQIKTRMLKGTIDIGAAGYDNESGYGIVMAPLVLTTTEPTPTPGPTATATPRPTATPTPGPSPTPTTVPQVPGSIAFSEPTYSVAENAGTARITVRRVIVNGQGDFGAVSVKYQTATGGTATVGTDYQAVTGTLSWADGDSSAKTFLIPIIDDKTREPNETVFLKLYDLVGRGTLASTRKTATLTIVDNEVGTIDKTPPKVAITKPAADSNSDLLVSNVDVIEGTASDEGGSGLVSVVLYIQRPSDGRFWNGAEWVVPRVALPTVLKGKTWSRTSGNPPRTSISDDFLVITAQALDGAGNTAQASARVFVDASPPAVYILSPYPGARLKALGRANGTVSDASGDSTLVLYLRRASDRKYWTGVGNNWSATATPLPVQLTASGEWSRSVWPVLAAGSYTLIATGTDQVGNSASATVEFSVVSASPSGGTT
ncbi:hypothetical protein IAD21_03067 [Abditibacteriota bacterium]|nr:hypothetical protein IAD21_03067 [Abditibacteriota bacterium]